MQQPYKITKALGYADTLSWNAEVYKRICAALGDCKEVRIDNPARAKIKTRWEWPGITRLTTKTEVIWEALTPEGEVLLREADGRSNLLHMNGKLGGPHPTSKGSGVAVPGDALKKMQSEQAGALAVIKELQTESSNLRKRAQRAEDRVGQVVNLNDRYKLIIARLCNTLHELRTEFLGQANDPARSATYKWSLTKIGYVLPYVPADLWKPKDTLPEPPVVPYDPAAERIAALELECRAYRARYEQAEGKLARIEKALDGPPTPKPTPPCVPLDPATHPWTTRTCSGCHGPLPKAPGRGTYGGIFGPEFCCSFCSRNGVCTNCDPKLAAPVAPLA